jgi:death on curing protein
MPEPAFLSLEDILFIHQQVIQISGGEPNIRDQEGVKACVGAPIASFGGEFLHDIASIILWMVGGFVKMWLPTLF